MSEVVCNTSPLQYLHQLGLLHLLPALAPKVIRLSPATRTAVLKLAGES